MTGWMLALGIACGLVALMAAAVFLCLAQGDVENHIPKWLLPGLSAVAGGGMILYGGSLLGSLYLEMTRLVSVLSPR
jgi:hypothetical protein